MLGIGEINWEPNYPLLFLLILPAFISVVILRGRIKAKQNIAKPALWTFICCLPISIYLFCQMKEQHDKEKWYVGTYSLEHYPNCPNCKLVLSQDNTYIITNMNEQLETRDWNYVPRSVSGFVQMNQHGHLGMGKFQFNKFEPNYAE